MDEIAYCTREQVQNAPDFATTAPGVIQRIDNAIFAAARDIEGLCHRRFYSWRRTLTFDLPTGTTLWLNENELSAPPSSLSSGGTALSPSDYFLAPAGGPPYRWIEINRAGDVPWLSADTTQRAVSITGDFGYCNMERSAGLLASSPGAEGSSFTVSDSFAVGVGDLLRIGSEKMIVREKRFTPSGATLAVDVESKMGDVLLAVSDDLILTGETILIDGEKMLVTAATAGYLVVKRARDGSALGGHAAGAQISVPRIVQAERAVLDTAPSGHGAGASILINRPPSLVNELALAYALRYVVGAGSAYASGEGGDNSRKSANPLERPIPGASIAALEDSVYARYGRKNRFRTVGVNG